MTWIVFFNTIDGIIEKFHLEEGDERLVFSQRKNHLVFTIGQRYVLRLADSNTPKNTFGFISPTPLTGYSEDYKGVPEAVWNETKEEDAFIHYRQDIYEAVEKELARSEKSSFKRGNNKDIEKLAFDKKFREKIIGQLASFKNRRKFSWVRTHAQLVEYLSKKKDAQKELIQLLKSVGISPFNDRSKNGQDIALEEIDPFTFFCYIYKYGSKKRLDYLQKIAQKLNLTIPNGEKGIPSAQAQKVWLFPYKKDRNNNEIQRLWNFFFKALSDSIKEEDFKDVLLVGNVGKTKITEALFYIAPEKYLPINGPIKPYITTALNINPSFNSYTEYIQLLDKIKQKTDLPFYELSYKAWKWNNQLKNRNYWIFQANPKYFDIEKALKEHILKDWTVTAHKSKIKKGDKAIIWITGSKSGCYAFAEIISKPYNKGTSIDDHLWKSEDKSEFKVDIKVEYNLIDNPIKKEEIEKVKELEKLKIGNQGTNFSCTEVEFKTLLTMSKQKERKYWLFAPGEKGSKWEEFYEHNIMAIGWIQLGDLNQYDSKSEINERLKQIHHTSKSKSNDAQTNWSFKNDIKKGDIVIAKKGRSQYLGYGIVTSDYRFDVEKEDYRSYRKVEWKKKGIWRESKSNIPLKTLTDVSSKTDDVNHLKDLLGINEVEESNLPQSANIPLNQILFGPPGTGKTYTLKIKYFKQFTTRETRISKEAYFESKIEDLTWLQVITIVLLDLQNAKVNDIFNHELLKIKASLTHSKTIRQGIWYHLQAHTKEDCPHVNIAKRIDPLYFYKDENSVWSIDDEIVQEFYPEVFELLEEYQNYKPSSDKVIRNYEFVTFHQSFSYEDFVEGIKPLSNEGDIGYEIQDGVFKRICKKAQSDPGNKYALFIDEINRGNVSAILGELITLIEEDKRAGKDNALEVTLPYSKDKFSVPPNLYIIGTMNTADRSVEALDSALRRRFAFEEVGPQPDLLSNEVSYKDVDLTRLLQTINQRIEKLIDKDHQIGHSYFLNVQNFEDLKKVFKNKIIPLLEEYFYNDYGKIGLILGIAFVTEKDSPVAFAQGFPEEVEWLEEKKIYRITNEDAWNEQAFISIYETQSHEV